MSVQLHNGDCVEVMRTIPSGSIDAIVTDPPYGQSNESYDRGVTIQVWEQCFRVCKPNAALISFAGSPTYHRIASQIEQAGWRVRQMWAWVYRNGFITSAYPKEGFDRLAPAFDPICYATKGKVLLNLERDGEESWYRQRHQGERPGFSSRTSSHGAASARGHWPRALVADPDVEEFRYFTLNQNSRDSLSNRTGHPNQKPTALMQWIVAKLPSGSLVLDPFSGSASTGVACLNTDRSFIGIEINSSYHVIAEKRIAAELAKTPLLTG